MGKDKPNSNDIYLNVQLTNGSKMRFDFKTETTTEKALEIICTKLKLNRSLYYLVKNKEPLNSKINLINNGLVNNDTIQLCKGARHYATKNVFISLEYDDFNLQAFFKPTDSLWTVFKRLGTDEMVLNDQSCLLIEGVQYKGEDNLKKTTLKDIGLSGGDKINAKYLELAEATLPKLKSKSEPSFVDIPGLLKGSFGKKSGNEGHLLSLTTRRALAKKMKVTPDDVSKEKKTVLRIIFPEGIVLQSIFKPTEKICDVKLSIKAILKKSNISFILYRLNPYIKFNNPNNTLIDAGLIPTGELFFRSTTVQLSKRFILEELIETSLVDHAIACKVAIMWRVFPVDDLEKASRNYLEKHAVRKSSSTLKMFGAQNVNDGLKPKVNFGAIFTKGILKDYGAQLDELLSKQLYQQQQQREEDDDDDDDENEVVIEDSYDKKAEDLSGEEDEEIERTEKLGSKKIIKNLLGSNLDYDDDDVTSVADEDFKSSQEIEKGAQEQDKYKKTSSVGKSRVYFSNDTKKSHNNDYVDEFEVEEDVDKISCIEMSEGDDTSFSSSSTEPTESAQSIFKRYIKECNDFE